MHITKRILLLAGLMLSGTVSAQVAFDAASSATRTSAGTTLTASHTFGGSNRAALVNVTLFNSTHLTATSLTVGGSSTGVTLLHEDANGVNTDDRKHHVVYRVVAPASGAQSVVFTASGSFSDGAIEVVSLTGVDQTTPTGTVATAEGSSAAPSVSVTSASGELVVDAVCGFFPAGTVTTDASQTQRVENESWGGNDAIAAMSTEAGAASVTMSHTLGSSAEWSIAGVSFKPVSAASTVLNPISGKGGAAAHPITH